jgi:hypothetical protein
MIHSFMGLANRRTIERAYNSKAAAEPVTIMAFDPIISTKRSTTVSAKRKEIAFCRPSLKRPFGRKRVAFFKLSVTRE